MFLLKPNKKCYYTVQQQNSETDFTRLGFTVSLQSKVGLVSRINPRPEVHRFRVTECQSFIYNLLSF